jgi:hypothetical protein
MSVADRVSQVAPGGARTASRARYLPIAEHGLIGDLHTVARGHYAKRHGNL